MEKYPVTEFQKKILSFYQRHGRHLPFRNTKDPYKIAVSEIMLQQTQVDRVVPKYLAWIRRFPNWKSLAHASSRDVISAWSGLGYNRRAIYLRNLAQRVVTQYSGRLPDNPNVLLDLPGIGPYTANAICIFAFNKNLTTIDTNIRRVLIHELNLPPSISLSKLKEIADSALPEGKSRDWHNALMDYAALRLPETPSIKPLSRQSPFHGSVRQIRGRVVKILTKSHSLKRRGLAMKLRTSEKKLDAAISGLVRDGLVAVRNGKIRIR
jgi:A/G-specific adenine glycosylase